MKQFITAAKQVNEDASKPVIFEIDGDEYTAFPPTNGQLALLVAAGAGGFSTGDEIMATYINFIVELMDEESHTKIVRRLMSRDDPFEIEDLMDVLAYLVEEFTGNPTKSPSGSTPSPGRGGQKSTASVRPKARTRSTSALPASAT